MHECIHSSINEWVCWSSEGPCVDSPGEKSIWPFRGLCPQCFWPTGGKRKLPRQRQRFNLLGSNSRGPYTNKRDALHKIFTARSAGGNCVLSDRPSVTGLMLGATRGPNKVRAIRCSMSKTFHRARGAHYTVAPSTMLMVCSQSGGRAVGERLTCEPWAAAAEKKINILFFLYPSKEM